MNYVLTDDADIPCTVLVEGEEPLLISQQQFMTLLAWLTAESSRRQLCIVCLGHMDPPDPTDPPNQAGGGSTLVN